MRGYLGLGSNRGERASELRRALRALERSGVALEACSSVWLTEPADGAEPPWFWNMVVRVRTSLAPLELLGRLQAIELAAGRQRSRPGAPREVDLDILWLEGVRLETPELCVPHPRMWHRRFVLAPLAELSPGLREPGGGRTVAEILASLPPRPRAYPLGPLPAGPTRSYNRAARRAGCPGLPRRVG